MTYCLSNRELSPDPEATAQDWNGMECSLKTMGQSPVNLGRWVSRCPLSQPWQLSIVLVNRLPMTPPP
jgi:hypothetical protein